MYVVIKIIKILLINVRLGLTVNLYKSYYTYNNTLIPSSDQQYYCLLSHLYVSVTEKQK